MIAQAKGRYIRVSPVKIRQIIDLIRGENVSRSLAILSQMNKGATKIIGKILNSAVSNAKQKGLTESQLFISKIKANQGTSWKRFKAVAFGRAARILKKTTHLTIELDLITK